jgi:squalene-associated FAD-dependent desaturase
MSPHADDHDPAAAKAPPIRSAVVMGGGLAGIAAAVRLSQAGVKVTLLETSRRLGGRATSHNDPNTGQVIDNCQHVLLGCCTNLIDLYRSLGVAEQIHWITDLHFFDKKGRHDVLAANDLPAPLHLSLAMLRFRTLSLGEKVAISRAMLAMIRLGRAGREKLGDVTFRSWLDGQKQPRGAIDKYWAVVIVSALNQHPDRCAANCAIQVFQDGFLAHRDAYKMGVASVPLRQLYEPAERIISAAGGSVRFGTAVEKLHFDGAKIVGIDADGQRLDADVYVNAMPFDRLDKVVGPDLRAADSRLQNLGKFVHSPILGIHLWFEHPVLELGHMIFVDSPLQWVFNKGHADAEATEQHLHAVISAADEFIDRPAEEIIEMAVGELAAYIPAVREVTLMRARVIKEKRATFSPEPGLDAYRPNATGTVGNLLLAGDWTRTGWPATMEGAVRSGFTAAGAALDAPKPLVDDLPVAELYQLISGKK